MITGPRKGFELELQNLKAHNNHAVNSILSLYEKLRPYCEFFHTLQYEFHGLRTFENFGRKCDSHRANLPHQRQPNNPCQFE